MPELDGLAATRAITADPDLAGVRVVILTTFELDEYVFDALRAGAAGFLVKHTDPAELVRAVRVIATGDALLSPSVTRRGPNVPKRPGLKSSNVSVVMSGEIAGRKPDCGRYLQQSQPGCPHGHARCRRASPAGTRPPLSGTAFRARQQPLNATHSFRFSWGNDRCSIFRIYSSGTVS